MTGPIFDNICIKTDSYKFSHFLQYPRHQPGAPESDTEVVYAYLESRGGKFDRLVVFGYQYVIARHLVGEVVTREKIEAAAKLAAKHGVPFHRAGWEYILTKHNGRLPLRIKAVPEGTVVAPHNVLMTVENTDPACYWLTNYVETILLQAWYPITVASQSRRMGEIILAALEKSGSPESLPFKLHDFGYRGVTCIEQAGIGGAAHLVNFQGTDTVAALELLGAYYGPEGVPYAEMSDPWDGGDYYEANRHGIGHPGMEVKTVWDDGIDFMPGFSIPASEHSTITSWGGPEHEVDAFRNMLAQYPTGLVACVSDSFDIYRACSELWGTELRDMIEARDGTLVIRPDSGDPLVVLPRILDILGERFGFVTNSKGYKVLNPKVRVIQGDGITLDSLGTILDTVMSAGWSADNLVFGSGGGLLQQVNRDTCKFAFKCSAVRRNGQWQDVYKDPVTDPGKVSKRGRLALIRERATGELLTMREEEYHPQWTWGEDILRTVFENGELLIRDDLATIRVRAALKVRAQ